MQRPAPCVLAALFFSGCAARGTNTSELQIMELVRNDGQVQTVVLANDYGFLMRWVRADEPELYLYDRRAGTIRKTADFEEFLSGLRAFPDGVAIDRIRGCGISAAEMPAESVARLQETIEEKSFDVTGPEDGNFTVCTCETSKVRDLVRGPSDVGRGSP